MMLLLTLHMFCRFGNTILVSVSLVLHFGDKNNEEMWIINEKSVNISHLASDWNIVAATNEKYLFPIHITVTSLRPDIVIYSNLLKRVILIELTCPCEENAGVRHTDKITKYSGLETQITMHGWSIDLFAIEVGARGYCSRTVTNCLKRLGFSNKLFFFNSQSAGQKIYGIFLLYLAGT